MCPSMQPGLEGNSAPIGCLRFGSLEIDEKAREVRVSGKAIARKPREFSLLLTLARNAGVAMKRERLLDLVWGFDFDGCDRTLDVHIHRLRTKIEERGNRVKVLHTLRRFGYKFAYVGEASPRYVVRARTCGEMLSVTRPQMG